MDRIVRLAAQSRKRSIGHEAVTTRQNAGAKAEDLAERYMLHRGLTLIERNFRVRGGEIDLICEDGDTLVFVEVRLRSGREFGGAAASITSRKQQRVVLAARHWLSQRGDAFANRNCRFDCVVMDALEEARIEWIKNAFSSE